MADRFPPLFLKVYTYFGVVTDKVSLWCVQTSRAIHDSAELSIFKKIVD